MSSTEDLILAIFLICREGDDLWLPVISMHCFDIIEIRHYIIRPFKLSQNIPNYVDTSNELYIIAHQDKMDIWFVNHATYLNL